MLTSIVKIKESEYILNHVVVVKINEDSSIGVQYNNDDLTEEQAKELIAEFFEIEEG